MHRLRRTAHEPRIEFTPLIDVIFLLLTFFVYAMVLMARVEMLPMDLQAFAAAETVKPLPAVTISIDLNGRIFVNREAAELDDVLGRVEQARAGDDRTVVYLALADGVGTVDRAPTLTALWDRLKDAGLSINFVGRPAERAGPTAPEGGPEP